MTGLEKLLKQLAVEDCPKDYGLRDGNDKCTLLNYYNPKFPFQDVCDNCWKKALESSVEER